MEYVIRYDVKPNMSTAFRQWLTDNEADIEANTAEGWAYQGTFFTVRGFGEYTNETRWSIADYAALGAGFGTERNVQLTQEWFEYIDQSRPWQATLYKSASEVDILPGT